jgi:uncharacterized lipoprotein YmbA
VAAGAAPASRPSFSAARSRTGWRAPRSYSSVADQTFFTRAIAQPELAVGNYWADPSNGQRMINFAERFDDRDGYVAGVVFAGLDLGWLSDHLKERGWSPTTSILIPDREGNIIFGRLYRAASRIAASWQAAGGIAMRKPIALPLAAVMLAGCGASDHSRFYVLTENPAAATRAAGTSPATTIALGAIQLPAALDRPQMARRLNSAEISYSEYDRWAGPLDDMVRRVLIADLGGRLGAEVILIENNPTSPASLTIAVNVLRFDADATGLVTLNARWETLERTGALVGVPRDAMIIEPGSSRDAEAVAATMSRAVADLATQIAASLGSTTIVFAR